MGKVDLSKVIADTRKTYAKDARAQDIICMGDVVAKTYTDADGVPLPEGNIIREVIGIPVLPYNKIGQVAGPSDTGKSTTAGEAMASAQNNDFIVILWDSEDKFDANRFAKQFGGNPDDILLVKTNEILKGAEMVRQYVLGIKRQDVNAKILIAWDSVGNSQSRSHAERKLDDKKSAQPGADARENSSVMKMIVALINKYPNTICVYLANTVYSKIGFMQKGTQENGGTKVYLLSSFIIQLKRMQVQKQIINGVVMKTGIISRATVSKNHVTQSENSVYEMLFEITAKGAKRFKGKLKFDKTADAAAPKTDDTEEDEDDT